MKNFSLYSVLLCLLFLASCATDIQEIKNNPKSYKDKTVTVKGKVKSVINVLLKKGFYLEDSTGEIFVLTENALPETGEQRTVQGVVVQSPELLGNSIITIKEKTR